MSPVPLLLAFALLLPAALWAEAPDEEAQAATSAKKPRAAKPAPQRRGPPYAEREDAMQFAEELAARRDLDVGWVRRMIGQAQNLAVVSRLMQPPPAGQPKNWKVYRSRFIDAFRIQAGVRFWQDNRATLERAEQEFGVPAATLAFDFPASHPRAAERTQYFRGELEQFLAYHRAARSNPLAPLGSYAGAWGMPQFMPSSLARWGVDYDGDRKVDLAGSTADVIGSVANYFKGYGWIPGLPTHFPVQLDAARLDMDALLAPDILPTFSVARFQEKGAVL